MLSTTPRILVMRMSYATIEAFIRNSKGLTRIFERLQCSQWLLGAMSAHGWPICSPYLHSPSISTKPHLLSQLTLN
jgi:hypothetical protein